MSSFQLGMDAFNGSNYTQAYSYFNIALQEDYNNPVAHFCKGLCNAYSCNLLSLNTSEMLNEYNIALELLKKQSSQSEAASCAIDMADKIIDFLIAYHNMALKHRDKFIELKSFHLDYWEICEKLLKAANTSAMQITFEYAKEAGSAFSNYLSKAKRNIGILASNANERATYKDGVETKYSTVDGKPHVVDKFAEISPPSSVYLEVVHWRSVVERLEDMQSAISQGISFEEQQRQKEEQQRQEREAEEEARHQKAIANKQNAMADYKEAVNKTIKFAFVFVSFCVLFAALGVYMVVDASEDSFEKLGGVVLFLVGVGIGIFCVVLSGKSISNAKESRDAKLRYDPETRTYHD